MKFKSIMSTLVFTITTSAALAQLRPYPPTGGQSSSGKPSNDPNRPGQYNPRPNQPPHHGSGGYYPPPSRPTPPSYHPPYRPPYYPPAHGGYDQQPPSHYPPPAPPSYYPSPTPPPYYGQRIVKQVYVGRSVGDEMYQLSYYADLSQYYGWEIVAVRATTRPNSPFRTVVSLVDSNRNILATQTNPGYQIALFPTRHAFAGSSDLYLWLQGSTFIDSIEVELLR